MTTFNVYCDESGHLPNDGQPNMVLGAIACPLDLVCALSDQLRALKQQHGLSATMEVKWTKVSPAKLDFYLALVDFFFNQEALRFRTLVIPDKSKLKHDAFGQDHDTWYYKMYFSMLTIDWTLRESARAKIRVIVKRILNKFGYPPDLQEEAVKTVLRQAELLCANWV